MKRYETKEQCIGENGEHAWKPALKDRYGCLVYHADGYCSHEDPVEECWHCPAVRSYTRTQAPKYEWIER